MRTAAYSSRVAEIDALRGFALLGILLVNIWFFATSDHLAGGPDPATATDADLLVRFLVVTFVEGKFYLLFSLLFGYGLAVQVRRSADEEDFRRSVGRRLGFLAVLGILHGVLLFYGDILLTYALVGIIVVAIRPRSAWSTLWLAVALTLGVGLLILLVSALSGPGSTTGGAPAEPTGTWPEALTMNARTYGAVLPSVVLFQGPLALAACLAGYALGLLGVLGPEVPPRRMLWRIVGGALPLGLAGSAVQASLGVFSTGTGASLLATGLSVIVSPLVTLGYAAALLLLLGSRVGVPVRAALAATGRLSLTNYLMQSVLLSLVFTGYGLGLMDQLPAPVVVLVAVLIFNAQVVASTVLTARFDRGPLEWLLYRVLRPRPARSRTRDG